MYFALELTRVKIWLTSQNPLQLEISLRRLRVISYIMLISMAFFYSLQATNGILILFKVERDDYFSVFSLISDFGRIICFGLLLYQLLTQSRFFLSRKISSNEESGQALSKQQLLFIGCLYLLFIIFALIILESFSIFALNFVDTVLNNGESYLNVQEALMQSFFLSYIVFQLVTAYMVLAIFY